MQRAGFLAVVLAVGSLGCPAKTAIWVVPGSSVDNLVFGISDRREGTRPVAFGALRVYPCGGFDYGPTGATWLLTPNVPSPDYPTRIRYGLVPPGFEAVQGPMLLTEGCYRAEILGTGLVQFEIGKDGTVAETRVG